MRNKISAALFFLVLVMAVLVVVGISKSYSPIPFWDMWNGGLLFYLDHMAGSRSVWWAFHSEHPNTLARLLFFLDYRFFSGQFYFLFAINVISAFGVCALFFHCAQDSFREASWVRASLPAGLFLCAWLLQWSQSENFTWEFQGVFFLVQLLPCLALYFLATSADHSAGLGYFLLACVLGLLSWGTMANAIFAFPILVVVGYRAGLRGARLWLLVVLAFVGSALYLTGFLMRGEDVGKRLSDVSFLDRALYILSFMGGPVKALIRDSVLAQIAGSMVAALSARNIWFLLVREKQSHLQLALRGMVLYFSLSAALAALGRAQFGYEQAFSSRYQTPVLMMWAALFLLHVNIFREFYDSLISRSRRVLFFGFFIALLVLLLSRQYLALKDRRDMRHEREVAALALEMGVRDLDAVGKVFPSEHYELLASISARSIEGLVGYASRPREIERRSMFGRSYEDAQSWPLCESGEVKFEAVHDDVRLNGWLKGDVPPAGIEYFPIVVGRAVVGFVVSGKYSRELREKYGRDHARGGFVGYKKGGLTDGLSILSLTGHCRFDLGTSSK